MPEQKDIRYTPWTIESGSLEICINCKVPNSQHNGVLLRRRVVGRDGETHTEYKVECPNCGNRTDVHRHRLLSIKEWESKQVPKDNLPHRSKKKEKWSGWTEIATMKN